MLHVSTCLLKKFDNDDDNGPISLNCAPACVKTARVISQVCTVKSNRRMVRHGAAVEDLRSCVTL